MPWLPRPFLGWFWSFPRPFLRPFPVWGQVLGLSQPISGLALGGCCFGLFSELSQTISGGSDIRVGLGFGVYGTWKACEAIHLTDSNGPLPKGSFHK